MVVVLLLMLLGAGAGGYLIFDRVRRGRTPPDLRGDWWARFEREFRAYARDATRSTRDRGRDG